LEWILSLKIPLDKKGFDTIWIRLINMYNNLVSRSDALVRVLSLLLSEYPELCSSEQQKNYENTFPKDLVHLLVMDTSAFEDHLKSLLNQQSVEALLEVVTKVHHMCDLVQKESIAKIFNSEQLDQLEYKIFFAKLFFSDELLCNKLDATQDNAVSYSLGLCVRMLQDIEGTCPYEAMDFVVPFFGFCDKYYYTDNVSLMIR
jgi:hypothetical protein